MLQECFFVNVSPHDSVDFLLVALHALVLIHLSERLETRKRHPPLTERHRQSAVKAPVLVYQVLPSFRRTRETLKRFPGVLR